MVKEIMFAEIQFGMLPFSERAVNFKNQFRTINYLNEEVCSISRGFSRDSYCGFYP
jgi:hypothetical protein